MEDLNKFHPSLRFTYEKSREKNSWMYTANSKFSRRNFPTDIIKSVSEYFKAIKKSHYSQLFSDDTHYNQEDYHRKQPASTQRPGDVPWRSPKGLNVRDLQETFRGLSEDQYKKLMILWKNCFSEVALHICFCFLQEEKIFKSSKRGGIWDVYGAQLRDVHGTKWLDFLKTTVGRRSNRFFKLNSQTHWTYFGGLLETL